jgi:cytochrome c
VSYYHKIKYQNPMIHLLRLLLPVLLFSTLVAAGLPKANDVPRPVSPWAIRSVLDKKPRMLTLALDNECYVAYDMAHCAFYKAWKGGIALHGAPYTGKKEVQPTSLGAAYLTDTTTKEAWIVQRKGQNLPVKVQSKGYVFRKNQIYLQYELILSPKQRIRIEERPEFVRSLEGLPGLERTFFTQGFPPQVTVTLQTASAMVPLNPQGSTLHHVFFEPLPVQYPPNPPRVYAHKGIPLLENSDCLTCHETEEANVGPSFRQIASRYPKDKNTVAMLVEKVQRGGAGTWGDGMMTAHPDLATEDVETIIDYIFTFKPKVTSTPKKEVTLRETPLPSRPGFGAALEGVHPSYNLQSLHRPDFMPRVAAMAFRPDGRLLVSTWDAIGGVYLLENVTSGDSMAVRGKLIASGLAEPLGMEVVNGEIFVLQKQELTQLIDHDGDEIIDEYRTICNGWGVTADFHEFAFGLVHKDGYFYATLSMAMRLKPDEKQLPDRGRTIKISKDGSFESVNFGLRTPNGIGLGPDNELFVLDNQGQWLPGNKLIHVRKGDYNGMQWGWLDESAPPPRMVPPALWIPENEIGNSPSEPVLVREGIFKGQLLHGDITHGGIKRDFLEKINGRYQGAVFRFTQGLEAGVNRLRWGPDGALYIGEVGMKGGGWSWKDRQEGLQKLTYNGKRTFEMLAIRAKPKGFEIEFTEPLPETASDDLKHVQIQQWRYEPTAKYGGPKLDQVTLPVSTLSLSKDRTRAYLEIPDLKKEHVVYFRLPDGLQSASGQPLWSSEAWYTLNTIPD